jgi:hypothetical protein
VRQRPTRLYCRLTPLTPSLAPTQARRCARLTRGAHLAGTAGRGGHRAWPPAPYLAGPSPAQASKGIGPQGPRVPPPPAPGRSRPAVRRNLAGPPPAGTQGPHCEAIVPFEGLSAKQGHIYLSDDRQTFVPEGGNEGADKELSCVDVAQDLDPSPAIMFAMTVHFERTLMSP